MFQRLRRYFLAGFFVTVPLVVSVVALVWMFRIVTRLTTGLSAHVVGMESPVLDPVLGVVMTAATVLVIGLVTTNVIGRRLLRRGEALLMHVPLFSTIYGPLKQLMAAFSPDNESGFKRVALVDQGARGFALGFLTREFDVDRGAGPEALCAVYVPTNNLYLGDVVVCTRSQVSFPNLTVEQAISVFLTGGAALPEQLQAAKNEGHGRSFRV